MGRRLAVAPQKGALQPRLWLLLRLRRAAAAHLGAGELGRVHLAGPAGACTQGLEGPRGRDWQAGSPFSLPACFVAPQSPAQHPTALASPNPPPGHHSLPAGRLGVAWRHVLCRRGKCGFFAWPASQAQAGRTVPAPCACQGARLRHLVCLQSCVKRCPPATPPPPSAAAL